MPYERNRLRTYQGVDLSNHLVHLTWRAQDPGGIQLPNRIPGQPSYRLAQIISERRIEAFSSYGSEPVACFSEAVPAAISLLISEGRYKPWGLAFSREAVFAKGGGPVSYVRGDHWDALESSLTPTQMARCVRYWPGIKPGHAPGLSDSITRPSEWIHEREWRTVGDFCFDPDDVEFLILSEHNGRSAQAQIQWLAEQAFGSDTSMVARFCMRFRNSHVVLSSSGTIISDPQNYWT